MRRSNTTMGFRISGKLRRHGGYVDGSERSELTTSACRFARGARDVVEDKLSFSATLMRAGEVDAAHRLLAEVEQQVSLEKAVLVRRLDEIAEGVNRRRSARRRLASLAAVSVIGALTVASSTIGLAVGLLSASDSDGRARSARSAESRSQTTPSEARGGALALAHTREVSIGGVEVVLQGKALDAFEKLKASHSPGEMRELLGLLPSDVRDAIEAAGVEKVTDALAEAIQRARREAEETRWGRSEEPEAPAAEEPADKPADPKPSPEPTPTGLRLLDH